VDLFQKFLNKVNRGYGQLDKNVFRGLLPGGAATPIGGAFQGIKADRQPPPAIRRAASVVDLAAGAAAGVQPIVKGAVTNAPESVKSVISSGLNALPFSVNLFGRYFTGLGGEGVQVPPSITSQVKQDINKAASSRPELIRQTKNEIAEFESLLNRSREPGATVPGGTPMSQFTRQFNDNLAVAKSNLAQIEKGNVPYYPYTKSSSVNPLDSAATSLGSVWFEPKGKGFTANEQYDFSYGGADKKTSLGPYPEQVAGFAVLSPSQQMAMAATETASKRLPNGAPTAVMNPLTNFGRAVVSKMPYGSFNYSINIP
jgi:hypothetical protein